MSSFTGTFPEVLFAGPVANYTAAAAASAALQGLCVGSSGNFEIPIIWGGFWPMSAGVGKLLTVESFGVITGQATATTATFTVGLNTSAATAGSSAPAGTTIAATSAITVTSLSNVNWFLRANIVSRTGGFGTTTVSTSLNGFAMAMITAGASFTAGNQSVGAQTLPTTIDGSATQYLYMGVTFSTASATNSCQCQQLSVFGMN